MRVFVCMEFQIYFLFLSDDDPDAFDFSPPTTRNVEIKLPLSGCQRKLYDDYLSSSQSKLDSLDAKSIASVLQTLRKVRKNNHFFLVVTQNNDFFFFYFRSVIILNFWRSRVRIPSKTVANQYLKKTPHSVSVGLLTVSEYLTWFQRYEI